MMRRAAFAVFLLAAGAPATAGVATPLVYATSCQDTGPASIRVEIVAGLKGMKVIFRRSDLDEAPIETTDVNLALVSRRLFFTLRTMHGLVEFQGHARADALTGLLSEETGQSRAIALPLAAQSSGCPPRPDAPREVGDQR